MFGESILWWLKNNRSAVHKYYICFGLEDGQMKRFPVDYYAYISLKEGEKGILMYQGNRFIEYDRGGE